MLELSGLQCVCMILLFKLKKIITCAHVHCVFQKSGLKNVFIVSFVTSLQYYCCKPWNDGSLDILYDSTLDMCYDGTLDICGIICHDNLLDVWYDGTLDVRHNSLLDICWWYICHTTW